VSPHTRLTRNLVRSRRIGRRGFLAGAASAALIPGARAADRPVTFGLTPVFLESDLQLLARLETYLAARLHNAVVLVKRRTYQEITALLLSSQIDAAWICGYPFVQHADQLALVAVPVYHGQPLYQSYIIVNRASAAQSVEELRGGTHAFSDPDSNSGFLVTRHLLATMQTSPAAFFSGTFFTYGHRNVVRAVASGLAQSGSVDGYVWDVLQEVEPALTANTRVLRRSELLGFPPVACNAGLADAPRTAAIAKALISMPDDPTGRAVLAELRLDGFTPGSTALFAAIAEKYRLVRALT
jgi:phosphonate transport system substrate-binding protein